MRTGLQEAVLRNIVKISPWRPIVQQKKPVLNKINIVMFIDNFQPESVDKSRPGGLVGNGETFELEFSGNGGSSSNIDQGHNHSVLNGGGNIAGGETYSWSSTERQGRLVDCLLIFDEETQVIW